MSTLQQNQHQPKDKELEYMIDPLHLTTEIRDDQVPDNFKPPPLVTFDIKSDPHKHIITINTQITIIITTNLLK